ncbi:hypothetical protein OUZ56_007117 [Daphnia magna]|uniref:Uncharacterized protein n=1 Tax=Daphnia magna TaxID=35525 RepID=A0ABQ9YY59_9CRUS|nr:hypothetical protein OUZ56_007117 [Daphnia magna]
MKPNLSFAECSKKSFCKSYVFYHIHLINGEKVLYQIDDADRLSGTSRTPGTVELLNCWRSSTPERTADLSSGKPSMKLQYTSCLY